MKYNNDDNKKLAELYYKIYIDCMNYKDTKKITNKELDCHIYLNNFNFFF
jgi:hypothetical protein